MLYAEKTFYIKQSNLYGYATENEGDSGSTNSQRV